MHGDHEAMGQVRFALSERLDSLQRLSRKLPSRDLAASVAAIRLHASAYGLNMVVRMADALDRAMAEGPSACPVPLYLERLYDAIGCERSDEQASEAMLASVSVRLGA